MRLSATPFARLLPVALLAFAAACGGTEADDESYLEEDEALTRTTHLVTVDPSRQDSAVEVKASIKGWTLWVSPVVKTRAPDANGRRFTVEARTSKNLRDVFAFVPDDAFGSARTLSKRKFALDLDVHELATLVSGMPIFVRLDPESGASAFAAISLQGRFKVPLGSTSIWLDRAIKPVAVNKEQVLRGSAALRSSARDLTVSGPGAPTLVAGASGKVTLDWTITSLAAAAEGSGLVFRAKDARGRAISKRVGLELLARTVGLSTQDPYDTWPPAGCEASVKACVAGAKAAGKVDLGACGDYRPVMACVWQLEGESDGLDISAERAAQVLRDEFVSYYNENRADLEQSEIKSLEDAQAMVSASAMREITDAGGAPDTDLARFRVFEHPDVVWESSDAVWFVKFDRSTGAATAGIYWN